MFGLFKKKLNKSSELEFLKFVTSKLGHEYQKYLVQINEKYVKDIDYKSSMETYLYSQNICSQQLCESINPCQTITI